VIWILGGIVGEATMTISDGLIIASTILGPILAVQAQKWIERYRESQRQKVAIFSTLMTTRATRISPEHVRALNTIDIVFRGDKSVIDRWHEYHDALSPITQPTDDKFIELLYAMSNRLKFHFDKVMLRRVVYLPQGHVDAETSQVEIQRHLLQMLQGQHEIQKGMLEYLEGRKSLKVSIDRQELEALEP
jgi:hypothetical protein